MAIVRTPNFKQIPLNIVGSSVFGRYPKIDAQYTYNMFVAQEALVPYPGYEFGIRSDFFSGKSSGRALFNSPKLDRLVCVFGKDVYLVDLTFDQQQNKINNFDINRIGELNTKFGEVYITENNKPQLVISDGSSIYIYDPQATQFVGTILSSIPSVITYSGERKLIPGEKVIFTAPTLPAILPVNIIAGTTYFVADSGNLTDTTFEIATTPTEAYLNFPFTLGATGTGTFATQGRFQQVNTTFKPGHIDFHDTFILAAARDDTFYSPAAQNTWRLSAQNNAYMFPDDSSSIGLIETKPDNTQAIFRFPSGGNMIFVMGENVTEAWFDSGAQLFPYQRNNQYNIDYGCVNPKTVAHLNNLAVWLAFNEKSGPIIMYSDGGLPKKITTDGIDFLFSQLQNPQDSAAFIYRQDGHTLYHINFFSDNLSLFYDFTNGKFYNASDQDMNVFKMDKVAFFRNQYFAMTRSDGDFYVFDTTITKYETLDQDDNIVDYEIPRIRTTSHIRLPSQDYFILNDVGFTIESGETNYHVQEIDNLDADPFNIVSMGGDNIVSMSGDNIVSEQDDPDSGTITYIQSVPRVDLSVSYNGGATFGSTYGYELPPIGQRRNRLMWWQGGASNDIVPQFRFWGFGRFVALDGVANIRV